MDKSKDFIARALANKARNEINTLDPVALNNRLSNAESKLSTIDMEAQKNRTEAQIINIIESELGFSLRILITRIQELENK